MGSKMAFSNWKWDRKWEKTGFCIWFTCCAQKVLKSPSLVTILLCQARGWGRNQNKMTLASQSGPTQETSLWTRPIAMSRVLGAISNQLTDGLTDRPTNRPTDQPTNQQVIMFLAWKKHTGGRSSFPPISSCVSAGNIVAIQDSELHCFTRANSS